MSRTITCTLTPRSIRGAINELKRYKRTLKDKAKLLCERLADFGLVSARDSYGNISMDYVGPVDVSVTVEPKKNGYRIIAGGQTVLFLEFGAGVKYGYGHPLNEKYGMGPTTYPGQKHAEDPNGWILPKSAGRDAGKRSYGNPPSMAMYNAGQDIRSEIERIAREVFAS